LVHDSATAAKDVKKALSDAGHWDNPQK